MGGSHAEISRFPGSASPDVDGWRVRCNDPAQRALKSREASMRKLLALALLALALAAETGLMASAAGTMRHLSYVQVFEPD